MYVSAFIHPCSRCSPCDGRAALFCLISLADKLPEVAPPRGVEDDFEAERQRAIQFFAPNAELVEWIPKPGLARHMGTVRRTKAASAKPPVA